MTTPSAACTAVTFTPGGAPAKLDPNGVYQVEQMYVQYFLPANEKGAYPLLMWHGGGLSGVTHAVAPSDTQQTDTYYIVAHFHYVLFGGAFFGFVGAFYFYWPKVFGYMLNETLGKTNFWLMLLGFNLTFAPMHILGLQGQPRRMYVWTENRAGQGFFDLAFWNLVSSIGALVLGRVERAP